MSVIDERQSIPKLDLHCIALEIISHVLASPKLVENDFAGR
jgi:hypothetical protein